jgi:hypothetical protein
MAEFSDYAWLTSDAATPWLTRAANDHRPALQQLAALRRDLTADRARLTVELAALRRRAAAKFGPLAERMFFTKTLLEQATDASIARYKASRLTAAGSNLRIGDYCCGIGGDLMAFVAAGSATGWDRAPVACLMAEANISLIGSRRSEPSSVRCADVESLNPQPGEAWHIDPDRRATGSRASQPAGYRPGPELIERWLERHSDGAVKLAPAAEPPPAWAARGEMEWISSHGECRQLVAWFGTPATSAGKRRATIVTRTNPDAGIAAAASFVGEARMPCDSCGEPGRYLFDPDPAVLASELLGDLAASLGLRTLGAGGAYLTGHQPLHHPLLSGLEVAECLPLRTGAIRRHLAARGVGRLEIKKRGVTVEPQSLRRRLKLAGSHEAVLVLTRIGRREVAIVAKRITPTGVSEPPVGG